MKKLDPKKFNVDWGKLNRIAPWSVISSRQLAEILGCHLQSVANYRCRNILPEPEQHPRLKGNKVYYRAGSIRAWLKGTEEEAETEAWVKAYLPEGVTLEQAPNVCKAAWKVLEIDRPI